MVIYPCGHYNPPVDKKTKEEEKHGTVRKGV